MNQIDPSRQSRAHIVFRSLLDFLNGGSVSRLFFEASHCRIVVSALMPYPRAGLIQGQGNDIFRVLGVCPSNPSLRGEGDAGRCEAAGWKKPEAYSLEYIEDFLKPRTTQMPTDRLPQ